MEANRKPSRAQAVVMLIVGLIVGFGAGYFAGGGGRPAGAGAMAAPPVQAAIGSPRSRARSSAIPRIPRS